MNTRTLAKKLLSATTSFTVKNSQQILKAQTAAKPLVTLKASLKCTKTDEERYRILWEMRQNAQKLGFDVKFKRTIRTEIEFVGTEKPNRKSPRK